MAKHNVLAVVKNTKKNTKTFLKSDFDSSAKKFRRRVKRKIKVSFINYVFLSFNITDRFIV
jgi:hypothetical protein